MSLAQLVVRSFTDSFENWELEHFIETGTLGSDAPQKLPPNPLVDRYVQAIIDNGGKFLMPEEVFGHGGPE